MNILINGLTEIPVPPSEYGGIERANAFLVKGLQELGHQPVLICQEGSSIDCHKVVFPTCPSDPEEMMSSAEKAFGDFDIVHDSSCSGSLLFAFRETHPVFWTVHGPGFDDPLTAYLSRESVYGYKGNGNDLPYTLNGVDTSLYDPCYEKDDYIVFIGQARSDRKFLHYFTAIAEAHKVRAIAIVPERGSDMSYFWDTFKKQPFAWIPGANDYVKSQYIRKAKCVIHCSETEGWLDAAPAAVLESMALGTPVIGNYSGGIPSMITDGVTGFLVNTIDEAIEAYSRIDTINPEMCRKYIEEERTHTLFAKRIEVIYKELAGLDCDSRCKRIRKIQPLIDEVH
jgi:glycosyltransferase involved in cell wall biosynthesis